MPDVLELLADMLPEPNVLVELLLAIPLEPLPPQFASTSIPRNVFVSILSVCVLLLCEVLVCEVLLCEVLLCEVLGSVVLLCEVLGSVVLLCEVLRSEELLDFVCVWCVWFWSWLLDELEVEL